MNRRSEHDKTATTRVAPGSIAGLSMIGFLLIGALTLMAVTGDLPSSDPLALSPLPYFVVTLLGMLGSWAGFTALGALFRRHGHPARSWSRTAMVLVSALPVLFVTGGLLGGPGLALGVAANGLGASVDLLWSAPREHGRRATYVVFLVASIACIVAGALWMTGAVNASIS